MSSLHIAPIMTLCEHEMLNTRAVVFAQQGFRGEKVRGLFRFAHVRVF